MLFTMLARAYGARAIVLARLREERGAVDSMTWMLLMGGFALAAGLGVWALRADVGTYFSDIMTRLVGCVTSSGTCQ